MTPKPAHAEAKSTSDEITRQFFRHSSAKRVNTDATIAKAIKTEYPNLELVIVPSFGIDLLSYASAGHASSTAVDAGDELPSSLMWKVYVAPGRRIDGSPGRLAQDVLFAKFLYKWRDTEFILYVVDGRDGTGPYPTVRNRRSIRVVYFCCLGSRTDPRKIPDTPIRK